MLEALVAAARRLVAEGQRAWDRVTGPPSGPLPAAPPPAELPSAYRPLDHVTLTDGVSRTLFEEYARHREGERGEEETGWILMGLRQETDALALATLPAGAQREAGVAHVRFNAAAQALASRILRQEDRRLTILGLVHTHPGSLRHPSGGDYRGDKKWVKHIRGQEGIFGIGTHDGDDDGATPLAASQPRQHVQCYLGFRFSWYALGAGDRNYRPLPVNLTIGPDLALPLHDCWDAIEHHAERLDRLFQQLSRLRFEAVAAEKGHQLHLIIPLTPTDAIRVVLRGAEPEYWLVRGDDILVSERREPKVDRGVFLLLADLAEGTLP